MTEQNTQTSMSEEQIKITNEFNQSVNKSIIEVFKANHQLMNEGVSATAVSLANALTSADLVAAMIVENNQSIEAIDTMLESLITDMRSRAQEAYKFYAEQKAKREAEAANEATAEATNA